MDRVHFSEWREIPRITGSRDTVKFQLVTSVRCPVVRRGNARRLADEVPKVSMAELPKVSDLLKCWQVKDIWVSHCTGESRCGVQAFVLNGVSDDGSHEQMVSGIIHYTWEDDGIVGNVYTLLPVSPWVVLWAWAFPAGIFVLLVSRGEAQHSKRLLLARFPLEHGLETPVSETWELGRGLPVWEQFSQIRRLCGCSFEGVVQRPWIEHACSRYVARSGTGNGFGLSVFVLEHELHLIPISWSSVQGEQGNHGFLVSVFYTCVEAGPVLWCSIYSSVDQVLSVEFARASAIPGKRAPCSEKHGGWRGILLSESSGVRRIQVMTTVREQVMYRVFGSDQQTGWFPVVSGNVGYDPTFFSLYLRRDRPLSAYKDFSTALFDGVPDVFDQWMVGKSCHKRIQKPVFLYAEHEVDGPKVGFSVFGWYRGPRGHLMFAGTLAVIARYRNSDSPSEVLWYFFTTVEGRKVYRQGCQGVLGLGRLFGFLERCHCLWYFFVSRSGVAEPRAAVESVFPRDTAQQMRVVVGSLREVGVTRWVYPSIVTLSEASSSSVGKGFSVWEGSTWFSLGSVFRFQDVSGNS